MARLGMRTKLLLLVVVASLPLVLLITLELFEDLKGGQNAARAGVATDSYLLYESVEDFVDRPRDALSLLAQHPVIREGTPDQRDALLAQISSDYPELESIFFLRADGVEAGTSSRTPEASRGYFGDRLYFQDALRSRAFTISKQLLLGRISGRWVVPLVQPVWGTVGRLQGFLVGGLSMETIEDRFSTANIAPGAQMLLFTREGLVIAHEGGSQSLRGHDLSKLPIWQQMLAPTPAVEEIEESEGGHILRVIWQVHGTPWYLSVSVPVNSALSPGRERFLRYLLLAVVTLTISLLIALVLGNKMTARLRRIAQGADRIGAGDLSLRLEVSGRDETAGLAQQINQMVVQLKRAMEAEQATRQHYQRLLGDIADGYLILQDGKVVFSNQQMATMLGREADSLLHCSLFDLMPADLHHQAETLRTAWNRGEQTIGRYDWELLTADGVRLPVEVHAHAIEYLGGHATAAVVRDMYDRRQSEEERLRLVREAAEAEALRELLHQKNLLISTISHELRTPLTAVMGFSEIVATVNLDPDKQRLACREIHSGALRLKRIIDEIIQFAEIQGPTVPVPASPIGLAALVGDCVREMVAEEPEHHFRLEMGEEVDQLQVAVAPNRFRDALGHLLSNASRFSQPDSEITVAIHRQGAFALVTVSDRGVGIASEDLPRVFQPFFRTESSYQQAIPGMGLGLATAKGLVEQWGGQIVVESQMGQGSTFRFTVPLAVDRLELQAASSH